MRPMITFLVAIAALAWTFPAAAEPPQDFTVQSPTHNRKFTLSEAKGKIVVLHFLLKTECPYCLRHTQTYHKKSINRPDVVHLFLKPDSEDEIKRWSSSLDQKESDQAPVIYRDVDAKLAKAFKIPDGYKFHGQSVHYPALIALDENGQELFRHVGKSNSDRLSYTDFEKRLAEVRSPATSAIPHRLLPLIHAAEVQRELKLSDDQVTALEQCFTRLDGDWFRSRILPSKEQAVELEKLTAEFWKWSGTALKPEQIKRLKQLELQALGSRMFLRKDIALQMKFTSVQREKLLALAQETDSAQKTLEVAQAKNQPASALEKSWKEATQAEQRGVFETLTDSQKQQLSQLIGDPFDTTGLKRIFPMAPEFVAGPSGSTPHR